MTMSKGLAGPQHCLVRQSVSSLDVYTCCPRELNILYLLLVSNPVKASRISTFCLTTSWSTMERYCKPGGHQQVAGVGPSCHLLDHHREPVLHKVVLVLHKEVLVLHKEVVLHTACLVHKDLAVVAA